MNFWKIHNIVFQNGCVWKAILSFTGNSSILENPHVPCVWKYVSFSLIECCIEDDLYRETKLSKHYQGGFRIRSPFLLQRLWTGKKESSLTDLESGDMPHTIMPIWVTPGSKLTGFRRLNVFKFNFRRVAPGCSLPQKMEVNGAALGLREAPSNAGLSV